MLKYKDFMRIQWNKLTILKANTEIVVQTFHTTWDFIHVKNVKKRYTEKQAMENIFRREEKEF